MPFIAWLVVGYIGPLLWNAVCDKIIKDNSILELIILSILESIVLGTIIQFH